MPETSETADEKHQIQIEKIEDEYYVRIEHEMTKTHYITFIAALSCNELQMVKLYPEGAPEARLKRRGVEKIFYCCNQDGLFGVTALRNLPFA